MELGPEKKTIIIYQNAENVLKATADKQNRLLHL